jgi:amino acid transporter
MFNLAYYNLAVATFIVFGWGSWLFPGADMSISVGVIGLLVDLPILVAYSCLVVGMPRCGGDYVFISRALSAPLGAGVALVALVFWAIFSFGQNAYFVTTTAVSPSLAVIGYGLGNSAITNMATTVIQPTYVMVIGLIVIAAVFALTMIPTRTLHKVLLVLSPIALLGYPILYVALLAVSNNAAFQQAFNLYSAAYGTSYNGIMNSAVSAGAQIAPFSIMASVAALPIVMGTLGFPQSSTYAAGETKDATRQVPLSLLLGVVVICASTYLIGKVTYGVFGFNFIQATAFYGFSGASGYPLPAPPFTNLFFGILYPNVALNVVMLASAIAWEILLMLMNAYVGARLIFSLAFDRIIPTAFADVSERFHTPTKANIIVAVASIFFLVATVYNFVVAYMNLIVALTTVYLLVMIAAIVFPYIKKDFFESFPPMGKKRIAGVPLMSLAGVLGLITVSLCFYTEYTSGVVGISTGSLIGTGAVVLVYIIGIGIYYGAKVLRAREGIDLSFVFKQIPPE